MTQQYPPHEILWGLCDHYLRSAAQAFKASTLSAAHQLIVLHVASAVRCLEAVLESPVITFRNEAGGQMGGVGILPPRVEAKTRLQLAEILFWYTENENEAEAHLQKAINDTHGYRFMIKDLQCSIFHASPSTAPKTTRTALKQAAIEAAQAEMYAAEGDLKGCHGVLSRAVEEAEKRGDVEMKVVLWLGMAQQSLVGKMYSATAELISALSAAFQTLEHSSRGPAMNETLYVYFLLINILYLVQTGNTKAAINWLPQLHKRLEEPNRESLSRDSARGVVEVLIQSSAPGQHTPVSVRLLSRNKLELLTLLVSSIAHKPNDSYKARNFLIQGLKMLPSMRCLLGRLSPEGVIKVGLSDHEERLHDVLQTKRWLVDMKALILQHMAEVYIIRREFDDAVKVLKKLTEWCSRNPPLWDNRRDATTLGWGMLYQAVGIHDAANVWLQGAAQSQNPDIARLSKFNLVLLWFGEDPVKARSLVDELEQDIASDKMTLQSHRTLLQACQGLIGFVNNDIRVTKKYFVDVLKIADPMSSPQLRYLSLAALASFFLDTQIEQAINMFTMAHTLAKKAKSEAFAAFCADVLAGLARRSGDEEKIAQFEGSKSMMQEVAKKAGESVWGRLKEEGLL
ncbi:hypothetical protein HK104_001774 [Borealophlyctis nickersoniae]|nr:hypothetical protein HK104_001774 [Borealophlyctis nickersoniae]